MQRIAQLVLVCLVWVGCGWFTSAQALEPVLLTSGMGEIELAPAVEYLEDPTDKLTLTEVMSDRYTDSFKPSPAKGLNFGFTSSTHWFRARLKNSNHRSVEWLLESQYSPLDLVEVFFINDRGEGANYRGGDRLRFDERPISHRNLVFPIKLSPDAETLLYIKVKTESSLQLSLVLWEQKSFLIKDVTEQYLFGLYYGVIIAMLLYNLMIFVSIRDIAYFYYLFYVSGYGLLVLALNGFAFQYLWPDYPWWADRAVPFFLGVGFLGIIQFSRSFLQLRENVPVLDRILRYFLIAFIFVTSAALFLSYRVSIQIGAMGALLGSVCILIAGVLCWTKGFRPARYFMWAWALLLVGILAYVLKTFGWLPRVFITEYGMQIGSSLEVILLSFALAYRMKIIKEENERIQHEATELLEYRVEERTRELNTAVNELALANRALADLNTVDGLTSIKNRKYFDERYRQEWGTTCRDGRSIALLMIDIDHFKNINDLHGHLVGDEALIQVAAHIQKSLKRSGDFVARYGGEEFVVVLPSTHRQGALVVAEKLRQEIEALSIQSQGVRIQLTVSVGVGALVPKPPDEPETLVHMADRALYAAKAEGRNCVKVESIAA